MPLHTDFYLSNEGTIFLLQPVTPEAREWADKYIDGNAMKFGSAIVIEHSYIADVVQGIKADGLEVR